MKLPIKSILSCLMILTTASDIHTQYIQELGSTQKLAVLNDKIAILGRGVEPGHIPIVTYSLFSNPFAVSVYIQKKKQCNFGFPDHKSSDVDVRTIQQLARNIIVLVWDLSRSTRMISVFHMDKCVNKKTLQFKQDAWNSLLVVPFANGFDVFTAENSRSTYDADGNLTRQKSFPINSQTFSITAVSKGFYVVDATHQVLNLVLIDGTNVVHVLKLTYVQIYSSNEQSLYSFCSFDLPPKEFNVHCFQYDELGHENWRNKVILRYTGTLTGNLDVKNLVGGGLVFIAYFPNDSQLFLVKMEPKQVKIWKYSGKQKFQQAALVEFNERDHTFSLAYQTTVVEQGSPEASVVLQKFSLV